MNEQNEQNKLAQMTQTDVRKLICMLAVPTIISMLITTFYNMVDTFFVGQINASATGAVGVVYPMMAIIQACGFFFGHGSGNYISKMLGAGQRETAEKMASTGFFSALAFGFVILGVGTLFSKPLSYLLGSTETMQPYAEEYLRIILFGAPFMTSALVLNNQFRFQGNAFYAMMGIATGGVLNVVLDPLLMFGFQMGVSGAAAATVLSQFISFCILLRGTRLGGNIKISIRNVTLRGAYYLEILKGGAPSLCRQSLASVTTIALNNAVKAVVAFPDPAIAAMTVVTKITMFANSAVIGFGQGFQPVCGFNYGAGLYDRVKKGFYFAVKVTTGFLIVSASLLAVFAPQLVAFFCKDEPEIIAQVIEIGSKTLRLHCLSFPLIGWLTISNMMMQNIGKAFRASFLAMARQGLFFIPIVLLFSRCFGLFGVQISQPVADVCSFAVSVPMQLSVLREMQKAGAGR